MTYAIDYRSWSEFCSCMIQDLFGENCFRKSRFLYRGQSSADWSLLSSYDRWFESLSLPEQQRMPFSQKLKEVFRRELGEGGFDDLCALKEDWILSVGQHYGLPTRLLDWSESPYIAAFFAFMGMSLDTNNRSRVAIWALDTTCYHWSAERGAEIIRIDNPGANIRLRNQEGRFTLLRTPQRSLDDYISQFRQDETRPLVKISLPAAEAKPALSELSAMGITPSRIYPDLHGLALAATLACRLDVVG